MFSDSFAGIAPTSAPGFMIAQLIGAAVGLGIHQALNPKQVIAADGKRTVHHVDA